MIACDTSLFLLLRHVLTFIYWYLGEVETPRHLSSLFFTLFSFVCVLVLVCVWCAWLDTYLGYTLESLSNFDFITYLLVELKAQFWLLNVYVEGTGNYM
jgi:hypothetical protein